MCTMRCEQVQCALPPGDVQLPPQGRTAPEGKLGRGGEAREGGEE